MTLRIVYSVSALMKLNNISIVMMTERVILLAMFIPLFIPKKVSIQFPSVTIAEKKATVVPGGFGHRAGIRIQQRA